MRQCMSGGRSNGCAVSRLFALAVCEPFRALVASRKRYDGARHHLADLAEDVFGRDTKLPMSRRSFEKDLGGLFVEDTRVDGAAIELAEGEERRQRHAAIAATEWTVHE